MKSQYRHIAIKFIVLFFIQTTSWGQNISINFNCRDSNNSLLQIFIPNYYYSFLDESESSNEFTIKGEYLYIHDSCLSIITNQLKLISLLFFSSEKIKPESITAMESAKHFIEKYRAEKIKLKEISFYQLTLKEFSNECTVLKYRSKNEGYYYITCIIILNDRVITLTAKGRDKEMVAQMMPMYSKMKLLF